MKVSSLIKKLFFLISIILFLQAFTGCSKKEKELTLKDVNNREKIQQLVFELNCYCLTGKSNLQNAENYYYPQILKDFLKRTYITNGKHLIFAEYFDYTKHGIIESLRFCDELDDAAWVDELLIRIEEERIANEISDMEETMENADVSFIKDEAAEIEKKLSDEIKAKELVNKNNDLIFMEYDDEIFIPQEYEDGWYIIQSIKGKTTRTKYDNLFRIIEREMWDITSAESAVLENKEVFTYLEDSYKVLEKSIESEDSLQISYYDENGLIKKSETYKLVKDEKYLVSKIERTYDDQQRILSDDKIDYYYKNEYKKLDYKFNKKYKYSYNENEDIPPDFEYYENGKLTMKNVYAERKGTYTSQIFFEEGFSVKTLYVDDLRSRDIYYLNNEVTRVKVYEE